MPHALRRDRLSIAGHHQGHSLLRSLLPQASKPNRVRAIYQFVDDLVRGQEHNRTAPCAALVGFWGPPKHLFADGRCPFSRRRTGERVSYSMSSTRRRDYKTTPLKKRGFSILSAARVSLQP